MRGQLGRCGKAAVAGKDEVVDSPLPLFGMDGKGTGEVGAEVTRIGGTRRHHAAAPVLPERGLEAPQGVPQPPVVLRGQEAGELEHAGAVEGRHLHDEGADEGIPQALLARDAHHAGFLEVEGHRHPLDHLGTLRHLEGCLGERVLHEGEGAGRPGDVCRQGHVPYPYAEREGVLVLKGAPEELWACAVGKLQAGIRGDPVSLQDIPLPLPPLPELPLEVCQIVLVGAAAEPLRLPRAPPLVAPRRHRPQHHAQEHGERHRDGGSGREYGGALRQARDCIHAHKERRDAHEGGGACPHDERGLVRLPPLGRGLHREGQGANGPHEARGRREGRLLRHILRGDRAGRPGCEGLPRQGHGPLGEVQGKGGRCVQRDEARIDGEGEVEEGERVTGRKAIGTFWGQAPTVEIEICASFPHIQRPRVP